MIRAEYDYRNDVQLRLLALMVRKPKLTAGVIEPHYFTNVICLDVARIVADVYEGQDLDSVRLTKASLRMLVWKELKESKRQFALKGAYMRTLRQIFTIELPDENILIKEAREFVRDQRYRQALVDAEKYVNRKNYRAAQKVMREAELQGELQRGTTTLPVYHLHRFVEHADQADESANHIVFPIIPTNLSV